MTGNTADAAPTPGRTAGRDRALRLALVAVLLVVAGLQLRAVARSGYSNDDVANSQIPMEMAADGRGVLEYWGDQTDYWRDVHGRFIPVSGLETIAVFSTLSERAAYKAFQILVAVGAVGVFVAFVRHLTGSLWAGLLGGLVAVSAMQVRAWNDPWLQYNGQQPTALVLVLAALGSFLAWARTGRARWLALALVPWTLCLMVYETTWFFLPLFPVLALGGAGPVRRRLASTAVMALPVLVLGLYVLSLRADATGDSASYTTRLDPPRVAEAFVEQTTAALPLTYATLGPAPAVRPWTPAALAPDPLDVVVAAGAALLVVVAGRRLGPMSRLVQLQLLAVGAVLWAVPAVFVATTSRWQDELVPGLGYVSVYVQTFGMALVAVATAGWWRARAGRPAPPALLAGAAVAVALVLVTTQHTTARAVDALQSLRWDREVMAEAVAHGLLDDAADGGRSVLSLRLHGWVNSAFVRWHGGPAVHVGFDPPAGCRPLATACLRDGGVGWVMTPEYGAGPSSGHVLFGPLGEVATDAAGATTVLAPWLRAWVRADGDAAQPPALEVAVADGPDGPARPRPVAPGEVTVEERRADGWMVRVTPRAGLVDLQHLRVLEPAG